MQVDTAVIVAAITGLSGAIAFIARAGIKGDWVFGREYKAMREDRDFWKREARGNRKVAAKAVATGEALTSDDSDAA